MTQFLAACRYILMIPVVGCVFLSALTVILGSVRIVVDTTNFLANGDFSGKAAKKMSLGVIESIDLFLIATVSYITAVGLYKLFIADKEVHLPIKLTINSLKNLEDKIIGVIVAALAVAFLGHAAGPDEPSELLAYGGGIAVVIIALALFTGQLNPFRGKGDSQGGKEPPVDETQ